MSEASEDEPVVLPGLDAVGGLAIPKPVQRGFIKAADRLLGAAVDIPAAWLEGFASDFRASTDARRELQMAAARKIAADFGGKSDLANRAYAQQASRILRMQINVEDVLGGAVKELSTTTSDHQGGGEPSDDWLESFRAEAELRSEREVQTAFSRILAGEIRCPGSFSIRTIRAIGQMDQRTAAIFQSFSNVCVVAADGFDIRVSSLGGNANQNALESFGLSYAQLNVLQENGLVAHDYHSWLEYTQFGEKGLPLEYAGRPLALRQDRPGAAKLKVSGPSLSSIGKELFRITRPVENRDYTKGLLEFYRNKGFSAEI